MSLGDLGKILPSELYIVDLSRDVQLSFTSSLTHLYQPLIGIDALSLYQTLYSESTLQIDRSDYQTHHVLMNYLGLPLDRIYRARRKLEAIGLLQTFESNQDEQKTYRYLLHPPLSSTAFFQNDFLSHLLYHQLGSEKFKLVKSAFLKKEAKQSPSSIETTAKFEDVFQLRDKDMDAELIHKYDDEVSEIPINTVVDFEWITQILEQRMLPVNKILTAENKKLINQMVAMYDLTNHEIEKALLWAMNDQNRLNRAEFQAACLDLVNANGSKISLKVTEYKQKISPIPETSAQPKSKEELLVERLEHISPKQLLEDLSDGAAASTQDLKLISEIMTQQGLTAGVMNVLVHYVMLKTDMKLSRNYLERIASHWARKNVKTVRQAMTLAKSENKKYQQWTTNTSNKRYHYTSNKKDIVPDWYKKQKESAKKEKSKQPKESELDRERKAQEADALLAEYLQQHANED
ncbi:replication initiation and membrane attachment family protein [Gracilibacillus dipsosauri]|uniref:replication initiation and membrane attachment family protein n=1 Tax=Gracilibacillus dipsosauri TaxID=178340 RepID=UPI0024097FFF